MRKFALFTAFISLLNASFAVAAEMPTASQTEAVDEWTYSLALQAASWGAPLVTMYAFRDHIAFGSSPKAPPNTLWRLENISTPELAKKEGYVTPNVNTIYGFGFMDLRSEPIVVEVPDSKDRYYMVEILDMWTNAFGYIGGKTTGYKGGKFILTGPGWKGKIPDGVRQIPCPTPWILIQPRVHSYSQGKLDLAGANNILQAIIPKPLSAFLGKKQLPLSSYKYPTPEPVNPALPVSVLQYKDPLQFWEILAIALNENPPPQDQVSALLPMFKPLGIELGKPWDRSKLGPKTLASMSKAAQEIGSILNHLGVGAFYKGATIPPATIGNFGTDYKTRAFIARVGLTANVPSEAIYWMYTRDENGQLLTGAKKYTMTFQEEIPYEEPGFWSITIYDAKNNYTVPNALNRYMLGSDTPELKKNKDGSFTIYIQQTNPGKDKESNWLPAPPGPFYLTPRSYAPKPEVIQILTDAQSWPVPGVHSVQ